MTVKTLIRKLKALDPKAQVLVDYDGTYLRARSPVCIGSGFVELTYETYYGGSVIVPVQTVPRKPYIGPPINAQTVARLWDETINRLPDDIFNQNFLHSRLK